MDHATAGAARSQGRVGSALQSGTPVRPLPTPATWGPCPGPSLSSQPPCEASSPHTSALAPQARTQGQGASVNGNRLCRHKELILVRSEQGAGLTAPDPVPRQPVETGRGSGQRSVGCPPTRWQAGTGFRATAALEASPAMQLRVCAGISPAWGSRGLGAPQLSASTLPGCILQACQAGPSGRAGCPPSSWGELRS